MRFIKAITVLFSNSKGRSRRQKVLAALMAIVVFCTTYALILPAITLDSRTAETEPGIEAEQAAGETLGPVQDESHLSAGEAADVAQTEEGKTETAFPETAAPAWTEADTEAAAKTETAAGRKTDSETAAGAAAETAGQTESTKATEPDTAKDTDTETQTESTKATEPDTEKDTDTETQTEEIYAESPLLWKSSDFDVEIRFDSEDWQLPEGTTLTVKELKKDTDTWNYYDARARKELKALDKNAEKKAETVSFYELTLSSKGKEIAMPKGAADLTISYHHDKESVYKNAKIFGDEEELLASLFWHAKEDTILFDKNWDNSPVISLTDHRISKIKIKDLALADFENVIGLFACPQTEAETETELKMPESAVTETEEAETKAAETEAETEAAGKKAIDENGEKAVSNTEIESALETETETKTAAKTFTLTAVGKDYTVTVNYGEQSGVPEGALLKVSEIKSGTGAFDEYLETARETIGQPEASAVPAEYARFFDITILADGQPVEPAGDVDVKISFHQPVSIEQMQDVSAVHFGENGAEQIEASAQQSEQGVENVTFAADSFSVYGVVYTVDFEYEINGQTYQFSLAGGEKIALSELAEALGIIDGTKYEDTDAFLTEVKDVTFSDESLVKVSKNLFGKDWTLKSLQAFSTEETLAITMKDDSVIEVKVTDAQTQDYVIDVAFKDADGNTVSNPSLNNIYVHIVLERNGNIYYQQNPASLSQNSKIKLNDYSSWKGLSGDLNQYTYMETDKISVYAFLAQYGSNLNPNDLNSDGTIVESNGRKVYRNGDIVGEYALSISDTEKGCSIVFQKPQPYTYTVKAMDGDTQESIAFTEGPWYLYGEVTRSDGVYFYVRKLENGGEITGTVDKLERYLGVYQKQGETVPSGSEFISFALLRPKDSNQSNQPGYFWTSDNMNVKALSGSSVDSKYTLSVVPGESHSDIILRKGPSASIELTSYDENNTLESAPALNANGAYFIAGELSFRDGLEDKTCYYVQKVSGNQSQVAVSQYFTGSSNEIQYLTGTRSFEPVLVYDSNASATADSVLTKLLNKDSSITIYRNSDPVESYRMTSVNGTLDSAEGKIKLNKLPPLSAAGEIQDKDGNAAAKKDAETYNLLVEITRDGKKAYAYQPLTFDSNGKMAPVKITDAFKEQTSGETWYYSEEDTPKFYVVKGSVANHDAAVASAERYAENQLMGVYTPSFTFDEETLTVTTVLKETEEHAGTAYHVRIDMMNKEQNDIEAVDPALTGNYYVLATLTPKGTGSKGQVVAWNVLNVNLSDLNPDGTWSGTIPADGFNVCNANMDSTGTKIGYNADEYDINLRLYHSDTAYTTYNDIREHADDSAPSGYDFRGVYTKENDPVTGVRKLTDDNTSVIRLHKAYEKEYGVRVYIDNPGLDIPAGEYVVKVKLLHETGNDTYAFAKLKIDPSEGGDTPVELEFYSDARGRIWRDQNGSLQDGSNYTFTGNEKGVEITLMSLTNGGESFAEWTKDSSQTNTYTAVHPGESIKMYTFTLGEREDVEDISKQKHYVYDVLRFTEDVNGISKGELDERLRQARDFGLYTELLSKHATDMEANIGAAVLSGEIGADYGFSGNNVRVNRITVTKQYYENGNPVSRQVTLRLYPVETYDEATGDYTLGAMISEKQGNTNNDGILKLEFDKLPAGQYVLKEVINGREYDFNYNGSTDGHIVDGNTVIQFQDRIINIENINVNYNYFGEITDNVSPNPVLTHSRHGLIVVGNDTDYNALVSANGGEVSSEGTTVKRAGADPDYPVLDIPADMENLRDLSNLLGVSANSKTVRIINTTFEEINRNNGLNLKSDGRYIVVNIDMTDAPSVATVNLDTYIDNHRLLADFGADGNEDSSKVLYNFITKDSRGNISNYTGKINTATQAAGVILAPSAIVADLGGNFGGTIICREAQHTGSEIHSDSANKIQNKNTMLTNGEANKGNLELIKSFTGKIDDRTTWFTFKVTAKNADGSPLTGEYSATGLKEGDKVTFDEKGEATVLVRAQNKVFIVGLPAGVTYAVEEVDTPETELYSFDHTIPESGSGTIAANTTSSVEVFNTQNKVTCDLVIVKTVEGPITEELARNLEFAVQVLDEDGLVIGYLDKDGQVSETEVKLKLSNGFTVNKDSNGYITDATKRFSGINAGKYRVIESNYTIAGYHFESEQSVTTAETTIEAGKTGRIDVKDVYTKPFEFTKIWKDSSDQIEEWPDGKTITVTLYSIAEGGSETAVDTFSLSAAGGTGTVGTYSFTGTKNQDNTYTFSVEGLPSVADGKTLTYYVKETKADGYQNPAYAFKDSSGIIQDKTGDNAGYAADEEYVINRPEDSYELPATGGPGTKLFTIMGSALILAAGVLLLRRRRTLKGGGGLL